MPALQEEVITLAKGCECSSCILVEFYQLDLFLQSDLDKVQHGRCSNVPSIWSLYVSIVILSRLRPLTCIQLWLSIQRYVYFLVFKTGRVISFCLSGGACVEEPMDIRKGAVSVRTLIISLSFSLISLIDDHASAWAESVLWSGITASRHHGFVLHL